MYFVTNFGVFFLTSEICVFFRCVLSGAFCDKRSHSSISDLPGVLVPLFCQFLILRRFCLFLYFAKISHFET